MSGWFRVAALDDLPSGRGVRVDTQGHRVAVFRLDSDVFAIGDLCSHAEASLAEGEVFDREVECPRHGSEFDLTSGRPQSLPATRPVPVYESKVEDGAVFLLLSEMEET